MSNNPKVILTGANGFLGSHLVDKLIKENYDVHCIVRKSSNLKWLEGKNITIHTCGLLNVEDLSQVLNGVAYVFHLAGTVSAFDYGGYYFGNVTLTQNLFDALDKANAKPLKIVVTSSQAVTGPSITPQNAKESRSQPVSFYGKSKLEQENLCKKYFDKYNIAIARPSIIYGERDTEFLQFIETVKKGIVPLVGFNDKPISSIYVKDVIEGFYEMAVQEKAVGQTYHLASEEVLTWKELGVASAKILNKKPMYLKLPHFIIKTAGAISGGVGKLQKKPATFDSQKALEGVQDGWVCSVDKIKNDLGFVAQYSFEKGIGKTITWYKEKGWL